MSMHRKKSVPGVMLDLWRPPQGAGDPIGCLATTYTFTPALFDEQCLGRFLEIESEPNRDDLAFLLDREARLGCVYAGVLVDHTQAGVEHSLRWDVLPVRVRGGKQHAKLSLLAWSRHVRIIVASANLTEPGYRTNHEAAVVVDLTPEATNGDVADEAVGFLRTLLQLLPGAQQGPPEVRRAQTFLDQVEKRVRGWRQVGRRGTIRQHLVFTFPRVEGVAAPGSSLESAVELCRRRGGSPTSARVASPFFDVSGDGEPSEVTAALCKLMARGERRHVSFCLPAMVENQTDGTPRLAAPKAILLTPPRYQSTVSVAILPVADADRNPRAWHAKMLALEGEGYSALMIGSSNFTCAGMGVGSHRNTEANLVTLLDQVAYGRDVSRLEAVWPDMEELADPTSAEWIGALPDPDDTKQTDAMVLPAGFLSATYRAGDARKVLLRLYPDHLPEAWAVTTCGQEQRSLLTAISWTERGRPVVVEVNWEPTQPPEKLLVQWEGHEVFLPLNVEDGRQLPPPPQLENMTADDMLGILAASDPAAAFRGWVRQHEADDPQDTDLDSATPGDLDPLRRYDLQATFLHRVRRRARVLAQLRSNLERPVWGRRALDWRLRGIIGIEPLANRLVREFEMGTGPGDEALLTIADFLIVLCEVNYRPADGSLAKRDFEVLYHPFLRDLAEGLRGRVEAHHHRVSAETVQFWQRVVEQCRA